MKARLEKAYDLLSDDGVIFISIDDNMQAYLKIICDEVFGVECFFANLAIELTKVQGMKTKAAKEGSIVKGHEYVLVYCKNHNSKIIKNILYDAAEEMYDNHYGIF
jgi:adenine specific DNA methylase Mod